MRVRKIGWESKVRYGDTTRYGEDYGTQQQGDAGRAAPRGVDEIIICPIIVPSTSRGGFFHLTMQLHICAFNIRASRSHAYDSPESTPFSARKGEKHTGWAPEHDGLDRDIEEGGSRSSL